MNVAGITGNLTSTPELKTTNSGISVCSFTVAVKRPKTKDKTDFVDCVAWRETAEFIANHFSKGQKIEISGYITTRIYGQEGNKRKATELVCEDVSFGGKKENDTPPLPQTQQQASDKQTVNSNFTDLPLNDDLPF